MVPKPKRKRGGQPGNRNAVRHGFYCRSLSEEERSLFNAAVGMHGFEEEVALLRCEVRKAVSGGEVKHLMPLAKVIFAMEKLIRTHHKLFVDEKQNQLETAMKNVFTSVLEPMGGKDLIRQVAHSSFPDDFPEVLPSGL